MSGGVISTSHEIAKAASAIQAQLNPANPYSPFIAACAMPQEYRDPGVEAFLKSRESHLSDATAIARAFRKNPRMKDFPALSALRKSGLAPAISKADLDVGTLTNMANVTGGQTMGYFSLDTQMARGTVRPSSFTLYQCLSKSRAYQVVDYWPYASDTGGGLPGTTFTGFAGVASGTLTTNAGEYNLEFVNLKLQVDGRAITIALAAQNSFVDIGQQENANAALNILGSTDWAMYWGNPTFYPNMISGLDILVPANNKVDFQAWYNANASAQGWSNAQALFNLIYQWAGKLTSFTSFGNVTHAFMSPVTEGSLQQLVTTVLNNISTSITGHMDGPSGIVVNGDLQGMRTRFGEILFPIDIFINVRDRAAQAILRDDGTNYAFLTNPTKPTSVTVAVVTGTGTSDWNATYAVTGTNTAYAVAACDSQSNESTLTWATPISGVAVNGAYAVTINPDSGYSTVAAFRVYRSGLGYGATSNQNPQAVRYVGTVAASGTSAVTFTDYNYKIPGAESIFLLDMDEQDAAIDYRYLLPLTKVELFAQNLYMPWAVASIGALRLKVPKFHGVIYNYVPDNPSFNPLSSNANATG